MGNYQRLLDDGGFPAGDNEAVSAALEPKAVQELTNSALSRLIEEIRPEYEALLSAEKRVLELRRTLIAATMEQSARTYYTRPNLKD